MSCEKDIGSQNGHFYLPKFWFIFKSEHAFCGSQWPLPVTSCAQQWLQLTSATSVGKSLPVPHEGILGG